MTDRTDTDTLPPGVVLVALHRPDGYEDVHPDIVIEDAGINPAFRAEDETATVRSLLAERDDRIAALEAENAALRADAERLDSGVIALETWSDFAAERVTCVHSGIDLRAAIDAAQEARDA